jgi:hypothetical protein
MQIQFIGRENQQSFDVTKDKAIRFIKLAETKEKWYGDTENSSMTELYEITNWCRTRIHSNKKDFNVETGLGISGLELKSDFSLNTQGKLEKNASFTMTMVHVLESSIYEVRSFYQLMFKNMAYYKHFVDILRFDLCFDTKNVVNPEALRHIYKILSLSCIDQKYVQEFFTGYIKTLILPHLAQDTHVGAHLLLNSVMTDNRHILLDAALLEEIVATIIEILKRLDDRNYLRAYILAILKKVPYLDGFLIKTNQEVIMKHLVGRKAGNLESISSHFFIVNFNDPKVISEIKDPETQSTFKYDTERNRWVELLKPEICYLIEFSSLMGLVSEGKCAITETLGQNLLGIEQLIQIIETKECLSLLKNSLMKFFYSSWLETERDLHLRSKEILIVITNTMVEELKGTTRQLIDYDSGKEIEGKKVLINQ